MPTERHAIFLADLLQDVNILRPLIWLARRDLQMPVEILMSAKFVVRDTTGAWRQELETLAQELDARMHLFATEFEAYGLLEGKVGILVSASETDQSAHEVNHNVFRIAPSGFLRITVQHGFECIGFLPNREHIRAHGRNIKFAADVICGWSEANTLTAVSASERSKLFISGPPLLLGMAQLPRAAAHAPRIGMVCENLHSVRMRVSGNFQMSYMSTFFAFCEALDAEGNRVTLRPHPAGQYFQKNAIALPGNVDLENRPAYLVNFADYAFGISAPSSVIIDMLLAGIPTAIWQDEGGVMDISNYSTLTAISSLPEWLAFRRIALENPQEILARQSDFLHRARMLTDPAEVRRRFSRLFSGNGAIAPLQVVAAPAVQDEAVEPMRVLFVAKSQVATLQLSFLKPLDQLRQDGELEWDVLTENELAKRFGAKAHSNEMRGLLERHIASFGPDLMVFCRYSGPHAATILEQARNLKIPSIYHIDDDLLSIPVELGEQKWAMHNQPFRLEAVRHLLDNVDLIYSSTSRLTARLREYGFKTPIYTGSVYCSGSILKPAQLRPVSRVGYMGTDHSHDFAKVASAVERYLDDNPKVSFEFFGSTPKPEQFSRFGDRVRVVPPIQDYSAFLAHFATMNWDIGICALADLPFNALKANTKWVEYTTVGTAVVGTRGSVYDSCMSDGCGILAQTEEEWLAGLTRLTADPALRYALVQRAQQRVETDYSLTRLRLQVLDVFREAKTLSQGDGAVEAVLQGNLTEPLRVIFISNGHIPTLQLSFIKPLLQLKVCGKVDWDLVTEMDMAERFGSSLRSAATRDALKRHIDNYAPNVIVFCRYSGPHSEALVTHAQEKKIPVIYHIDDDLLNIPIEIGEKKWLSHNQPARLASVRHLLSSADLIYASTNALRDRLQSHGFATPMFSAPIYCSGSVLNRAVERPVTRIGYMGFDHAHDFALVIPPLLRYLDRNPHVIFELFGSIPKPPIFDRFGERFRVVPPVRDYSDFLKHFAALNWDIGICPLANTPFNAVKANTKWVEYTSVGAAVVATRGTIYDSCTAGDCGILAGSEDEWLDAFERLTADPALRRAMVERAQQRLEREYSVPALTRQVLDVFECAKRKVLKKRVSPEVIFTS